MHVQIRLGHVQLLDLTAVVMPWIVLDSQRVLSVSVILTVTNLATAVLTLRRPVLLVGHALGTLHEYFGASRDYIHTFFVPTAPGVSLQFEQEMYTINEVAGSQALAVLVCLVASNTERNYTVILRPIITTATRRAMSFT